MCNNFRCGASSEILLRRSNERNLMKKYKTELNNFNIKVKHVLDLS